MLGLILSLAAASISFILLVLSKNKNSSKRIVLIIATIGFMIILGQQFLNHFSSKASSAIIANINKTTTKIDSTVSLNQLLLIKLDKTSIDKIGIELESPNQIDNLKYFDKGAAHYWKDYYAWLNEPFAGKKALRFVVNNNRHYTWSLMLLYLGSNTENGEVIQQTMRGNWTNFGEQNEHWNMILAHPPLCEVVVFERKNGETLGFAHTSDFLRNMETFKNDREKIHAFEDALNDSENDFKAFAASHLGAFNEATNGETLADIGNAMIDKNIGQTIAQYDSKNYLLQISSIFKLK